MPACHLVSIISSAPNSSLPIYHISPQHGQLGLPQNIKLSTFIMRGFGLKKKCIKWLEEWQRLPYTSPYADASDLDSRTDVSEKRIVGVFHELLNLMIQKMTQRKNVSNLRKPLDLPQKFTKVFGRHPGIFYISQKCSTQTVVLRDAYYHQDLLDKHPLVAIRQQYASMMKIGFQNRSRGLYKKFIGEDQEEGHCLKNDSNDVFSKKRSTEDLRNPLHGSI
ncbi:WHAT'S THIS FACTOR 9 protein [Thalictrum thalictroides]|uniref:WHAT'S THIS FACTOR 9 protein n=1 Tax=Thalictrum thalictroides TaxID=46969 RepID=A0A7J6VZN7_THATH|nr:WHAT'S THIS FACTOR 9 protein [Thalictrum thalictroides]